MIQNAETRLHELRQDELSDVVLAALAMGAALTASFLHPPLALPLFAGAVAGIFLAGRAFFRRLELVDRLLLDRDAYTIPEIRRRADRLASMEGRRTLAQTARSRLTPGPDYPMAPRVAAVADELRALTTELEDEGLSLEPACAARCHQLLTNYADSPLLNGQLPAEDAAVWIRRIRSGFEPRSS